MKKILEVTDYVATIKVSTSNSNNVITSELQVVLIKEGEQENPCILSVTPKPFFQIVELYFGGNTIRMPIGSPIKENGKKDSLWNSIREELIILYKMSIP
jgi:hypothetical protein